MSGQAEKLNSATLQPQNVTNDDRPIESPPPSIPTDLDFSVPDMPVVLLEPKIFSSFGLRWLSDYYRSDVRREYGARMAVFEATRAIPERDKDVIRSRVSYAVGVLKADEAWMEAVRYCVNWFYDGVFRAGWVMVPTIVSFWLWSGLAKLELVLFTAISLILWIGAGLDAKSKRRRSMLDASLMLLFVAWPVLLVLGIWRWKTDGRWEALAILLSSISICRLVGVVANFSLSLVNAKLAVALFLGTLAVVYVSSAYYLSAVVMWIAKGLGSEILIITVIGLLLLSLLSRLGPRRQSRSRSPGGPMLGSLVYLSALGLGYILANQAPEQSAPRWMTEGVQGGLWASIVILLLLGSLNVATSIFRSVLGFIVYRKYPHFDIIDELILLLDWIDWSGADWESPAYRSRIADELEYLARRFERSLPLRGPRMTT